MLFSEHDYFNLLISRCHNMGQLWQDAPVIELSPTAITTISITD